MKNFTLYKRFYEANTAEKLLPIERNRKLFSVEDKLLQNKSFYNAIQSQTTSISLQACPPMCFAELSEQKNKFSLVQINFGIKTPEPEFRIKISPRF